MALKLLFALPLFREAQLMSCRLNAHPIRRLLAALIVSVLACSPSAVVAQIKTAHDTIPDFCASPSVRSVRTGSWSDPSTWSPSRVPSTADVVRVASGHTVTLDIQASVPASCVGVDGTLTFSRTVSTRLWAGNVIVYANGYLDMGTSSSPIPVNVDAEIMIADQSLNLAADPDQYGTALIVFGRLRVHGATKTPTWTRLAQEPRAGATTLTLSQPVTGWQPGDRVVLPDTRHMKWNEVTNWSPTTPQWEELSVQTVAADGRSITVTPALRYDHLGARDGDGALTFLPHVGNLSRNVVIRSEAPIGSGGTLGHTMFTARADVDIRYASFKDLGRTTNRALNDATNHIGRYAVHIHHLAGPVATPANGHQFTFVGNGVDGGSSSHRLKWGLAIHNSHYGLIQQNVFYNWAGSAVMFEDGSESYNLLDSNFAIRSRGTGDRVAEGTEGGGFWFRGPNNYIRGNVAANHWGDTTEAAYGFKFYLRYLGNIRVPNHKGADTSVAGQYSTVNGNRIPILEFADNEVYGGAQGLTYWWVSSQDPQPYTGIVESIVRNLRIWHVYNVGIYHYPAAKMTFDGLVIRGKDPASSACCGRGFHGEDYAATQVVLRNANIQGMTTGISLSSLGMGTDVSQTIENSVLRNQTSIRVPSLFSVNGTSWIPARKTVIRNVRFQGFPGVTSRFIDADWNSHSPSGTRDEIFVYAFQGVSSDNFQLYYAEQATQAIAGGLAPCSNTRSSVGGLVCPISGETSPPPGSELPPASELPAAPTNVRIVSVN